MTYCVAIKLHEGLVFLSDSRTNAGVDHISSFRKMTLYQRPGERFVALMSSGNLGISQSVREVFHQHAAQPPEDEDQPTLWTALSMFDVARALGTAIRVVHERDAKALERAGVDFNVSFLLGGQVAGEGMRLFQVYAAGNFIEACDETPYFQIGEAKYGKSVLDRVITPSTPLDEAAKCALISMDSTINANLSVGMPMDLVIYEAGRFETTKHVCIDERNPYYRHLRDTWSERLREMFDSIEDPVWDDQVTAHPIRVQQQRCAPLAILQPPAEAQG